MNLDWQNVAAAAVVIAAVAYIARRIWRAGKLGKEPPCADCPVRGAKGREKLVSIEPPPGSGDDRQGETTA